MGIFLRSLLGSGNVRSACLFNDWEIFNHFFSEFAPVLTAARATTTSPKTAAAMDQIMCDVTADDNLSFDVSKIADEKCVVVISEGKLLLNQFSFKFSGKNEPKSIFRIYT